MTIKKCQKLKNEINDNYMIKFLKQYFAVIWELKFSILLTWFFFFWVSMFSKSPYDILHLAITSFIFTTSIILFIILIVMLLPTNINKK